MLYTVDGCAFDVIDRKEVCKMTLDGTLEDQKQISVGVFKLTYCLSRSLIEGRDSYSVCVSMLNTATGETEESCIPDVTSIKEEASRIFRLISEGTVTPMTLNDVVYDLIV